jgi:hypothetical protein
MAAVEMILVRDGDPFFARQHSLIAFQQQRLGFGEFLLPREADTAGLRVTSSPEPKLRLGGLLARQVL